MTLAGKKGGPELYKQHGKPFHAGKNEMSDDTSLQQAPEEAGGYGDFEPDALLRMAALTRDNPAAASVVLTILAKAGDDYVLMVSHATLAKLCNLTVPTVEKAVADLIEEGWIKQLIIGSGDLPIAYAISSRVHSPKDLEGREYSDFQARIILSTADRPCRKSDALST